MAPINVKCVQITILVEPEGICETIVFTFGVCVCVRACVCVISIRSILSV